MIQLPLSTDDLAHASDTVERVRQRLAGAAVLVVDDHQASRELAVALLARLGCKADVAHQAQDALIACKKRSYMLILMDCNLPDMDGAHAALMLRREGLLTAPGARIIALSADVFRSTSAKMHSFDEILHKPVSLAALTQCLAEQFAAVALMPLVDPAELCTVAEAIDVKRELDEARIAELQQLANADGQSFWQRFAPATVTELTTQATVLEQQAADLRAAQLVQMAHSIKGSALLIGATGLAAAAAQAQERFEQDVAGSETALWLAKKIGVVLSLLRQRGLA